VTIGLIEGFNDYTNPNTNSTRPSRHITWTGADHTITANNWHMFQLHLVWKNQEYWACRPGVIWSHAVSPRCRHAVVCMTFMTGNLVLQGFPVPGVSSVEWQSSSQIFTSIF